MKRPYLNQHERQLIHLDTFYGAKLLLHLSVQKLRRDVYKSSGFFAMRRAEKYIVSLVNYKLFKK